MVVCVTGFGWSGSGVAFDLLREYSDINIVDNAGFDWEFYLLHDADGIYDLEHKLLVKHNRIGDSDIAINRFIHLVRAYSKKMGYEKIFHGQFLKLSEKYVNELIDFQWYGRTFYDIIYPARFERIAGIYNRVINRLFGNRIILKYYGLGLKNRFSWRIKHLMRISYQPDNFLEITREYLRSLIDIAHKNKENPIVFDQIFPPDCPQLFFKYVDNPKCIIVRRDPRDTYLLAKKAYGSSIPIPVQNVDDFILFYKKVILDTYLQDDDNILSLQFEDLIYQYDKTVLKIEQFLGIKDHSCPKSFFNPVVSMNNTCLYEYYTDYSEDIEKIKMALPQALYPFEKYRRGNRFKTIF